MEIIAHRKKLIWIMYFAVAVSGIVMMFIGDDIVHKIVGGVLLIVSAVILIQYFMVPPAIISLDKNKKLYLPKGIILNPKDIVDVSYSKASGRSIQYKWGSVTIMTATAKYKYKFVADCEAVSKTITDIVYKSKSFDMDIFQ